VFGAWGWRALVGLLDKLQQEVLVAHLVPEMTHEVLSLVHDPLDALVLAPTIGAARVARQQQGDIARVENVNRIGARRNWEKIGVLWAIHDTIQFTH
jgi:hypothetical protein